LNGSKHPNKETVDRYEDSQYLKEKMRDRKESIKESREYIYALGNENIIRNYIKYFEKKLEAEVSSLKEIKIPVSSVNYPNFAAWIRFYTELICNSLYWRLFRYEGDWKKINEYGYGTVRKMIIERIKKEITTHSLIKTNAELKKMKKAINLVLNLRHSFQHGGLPNTMRELWYGSNKKDFIEMLNPNNYKKTKKTFSYAEDFIKLLPQPTIKFYPENYLNPEKTQM